MLTKNLKTLLEASVSPQGLAELEAINPLALPLRL